MKVRTGVAVVCLALGLGLAAEAAAQKAPAASPGPDTKVIAAQLVKQIAGVKPGDTVLIEGELREWALLEDLWIEVQKAGGLAMVVPWRELGGKRYFDEVPAQFDAHRHDLWLKLLPSFTVNIVIEGQEYPALLKQVPPARIAASDKAFQPVYRLLAKRNMRRIFLGNALYPTGPIAKRHGMTKDQLAKIFWAGVTVDPTKVQAAGEATRAVLAKGKEVRITNPNGTDLKFRIQNRPVVVSDGVLDAAKVKKGGTAAWTFLPAGDVMVAPVKGTAEGKIVVDRLHFEDGEIIGLTASFKAGKLVSFTANPGPLFDRFKALYDGAGPRKDEFAGIDIGVNPAVTIPKGSKLLAWMASGMVTTGIGGNLEFGGDNSSGFGSWWHLPGSTLLVDGKPLIEKGELKVAPAATASK